MALNKKKISDYPIADSLVGLWTLGYSAVDGIKKSFRVSLEFLKSAADRALASAQAADDAVTEAKDAASSATTAAGNASAAASTATTAAGQATTAATAANTAAAAANAASARLTAAPRLEIRVVRKSVGLRSTLFPNEINKIMVDKLQYRICAYPDVITSLRSMNWRIALLRPKSVRSKYTSHGNKIVGTVTKRWFVCDDNLNSVCIAPSASSYPNIVAFPSRRLKVDWFDGKTISTWGLPQENVGQWIDVPYDMEYIMRRYVYLARHSEGEYTTEILPMDKYDPYASPSHPTLEQISLHISGTRKTQCIWGRLKGSDPSDACQALMTQCGQVSYCSIPLAIGLVLRDETNTNQHHYVLGPTTEFKGIICRRNNGIILHYTAKISGSGVPKVNSKRI